MAGPGRAGRQRGSASAPSTRGRGRPPGRPRRRRDSDSTVASVDTGSIEYVDETQVLKKLRQSELSDSDSWPCFVLKDAVVYRKTEDGQLEIANVCNVDLDGPLIVRGLLEIDPQEHKSYLRQRGLQSAHIEIKASVSYSIGYGPWPAVWAAGKAGWYELNPSAEYAAMYETVCEGISLYYLIMEVYLKAYEKAPKAKKTKLPNIPVERVLFQYAVANGDGLTLPEAQQRAQKHATFLLSHFPKEQDVNFSSTSFARWVRSQNQALLNELADRAAKRYQALDSASKPPPESSSEPELEAIKQSDDEDVQMRDAQISQSIQPSRVITPIHPPRPGQAPSAAKATPPAPLVSTASAGESGAQSEDPVRFLVDLFEEVLERTGDVTKVKEGTIHSNIYMKCSIKNYHAAKDVTHYYAKALVASLNPKWYNSPFFQWLKTRRDEPWSSTFLQVSEVPGQCVRRKKTSATNRPQAAVAGKHFPATPRPSGKNAGLRPGGSSKRPYSAFEDDEHEDEDEDRLFKTSRTSSSSDSDEEEEIDTGSDAAPATVPHSTTPIPIPAIPNETVRVVVRAERIPSMSPAGDNGTWECQEQGCNFIVRAADTAEGEEKISEHLKEHTACADKINLALAEGTRGHLPINHLLEKIRTLGESSKDNKKQDKSDENQYPKPIKRRLLI